jgi:hypothetical protein
MYLDNDIEELVIKPHALLTMLQRDAETTFDGRYWYVPVMYVNPVGASFTAATAESNEVASKQIAFNVRPSTLYQYPKIAGPVVRAAKRGGANQLIDLFKSQVDGGLRNMGNRIAKTAYGNAGGYLARVSSATAPSGNTLTLANPEDTVFFEPGMKIAASHTDGTTGAVLSGGTITIVSVDRVAGTLSGSAAWSGLSGITTSDYLFADGDFGNAPSGLLGWCPTSAPSVGESFNGVDRSVDATRLGGLRYNGSSESFETVIIKANALAAREGMQFAKIFINPTSKAGFEVTKEGQKIVDNDNEYGFGIQAFDYMGARFYVDQDCPVNTAFALEDGAYKLASLGQIPSIGDDDGNQVRLQSGDVFQVQLVADYSFLSPAPGRIMNITLPSFSL